MKISCKISVTNFQNDKSYLYVLTFCIQHDKNYGSNGMLNQWLTLRPINKHSLSSTREQKKYKSLCIQIQSIS